MKDVFSVKYDESKLLYRNDFETDLNGWVARGPESCHYDYLKYEVRVELTDEEYHSGKSCMKISGRTRSWNGASLDITNYLKHNVKNYVAMVWVKMRNDAAPSRVHLSLETNVKLAGVDFPVQSWWDDYNPERNLLSKFKLPTSIVTPESTGWDIRYPPNHVNKDGWVLLRGKININKK
ncbi:MAG: carbohydrate binding domain-containing protein [Oscillospiraceae bacterium]|nr:carbohydrate binding domain-containing protein [Oscillospiraceae bacterium]